MPLSNSVWTSLLGAHKHLGMRHGGAARYFADISPFAALEENTGENLSDLSRIVEKNELVLVRGEIPQLNSDWKLERHIYSRQMILPRHLARDDETLSFNTPVWARAGVTITKWTSPKGSRLPPTER